MLNFLDGLVAKGKFLATICSVLIYIPGLHAYACDCVTHHLFHPRGTDCLRNPDDELMMHQIASDDSLQSLFKEREKKNKLTG